MNDRSDDVFGPAVAILGVGFAVALGAVVLGHALEAFGGWLNRNSGAILGLLALGAAVFAAAVLYKHLERYDRGKGESARLYQRALRQTARIEILDRERAAALFTSQLTERLGFAPSAKIIEAALALYEAEDFTIPPPPEGNDLVAHARYRQEVQESLSAWRGDVAGDLVGAIVNALAYIALPPADDAAFTTTILTEDELDIRDAVREVLVQLLGPEIAQRGLFSKLRTVIELNNRHVHEKYLSQSAIAAGKTIPVTDHPGSPEEIVDGYFTGTPLRDLFYEPVPFEFPQDLRFEHTHIIAGSGYGKTQLLQHLLTHDLKAATQPALVVVDSQGDMIAKLRRLVPDAIVVDPRNVLQLNVFDLNRVRLEQYGPQMREQLLNGAIELYDYLFSILGADITRKQSVFFRYSLRLLLSMERATILDLLQLMENPTPYLSAIASLPPIQRRFFDSEKQGFFSPTFKQTKEQIAYRLSSILENDTFARMLCAPRNEVDMFSALNSGKVVLVNTAKDYLKSERSSFMGRLFIALTMNAAFERAALPESERRPAFLYIDEASEYFDDNIDDLLVQSRKFNLGCVFSHQYLEQCTPSLRASIAANTSIKMAGGVSDRDARALASDMRTTAEFILGQRKGANSAQFACALRGQSARSIAVPFGTLEFAVAKVPPHTSPNPPVDNSNEPIVRFNPRPAAMEPWRLVGATQPPKGEPIIVGDFIQWTANGVTQFKEPRRVRDIQEHQSGIFIFVEGSKTGIPADEARVIRNPKISDWFDPGPAP